jgi:hypothetical protein
MRIFLSFASEQQNIAETISLALRDRGHSVFFAKDDLPPGASYDARIQKGVDASDLMLFLVSPDSVKKGRYTLTELSYARQRWPNPNGRVLPVLVLPTPLDTVPAYLKAVTILEPLGSIAAETSAEVDKLSKKSHHLSLLKFGLFGVVSAICSYLSVKIFGDANTSVLSIGSAPFLPGLFFGVLVSACTYQFGARERFLLLVTILFTVIGWVVAVNAAVEIGNNLGGFSKTQAVVPNVTDNKELSTSEGGNQEDLSTTEPTVRPLPFVLGFAGIVGGFIGGVFTFFGIAVASPIFRSTDSWTIPLVTAAALGSVLEFLDFKGDLWWLDHRIGNALPRGAA